MQHKLFKTHRKRSYYQLRKLSSFSLTLALAFVAIVVPLTLNVGASTTSDPTSVLVDSSSNEPSSSESTLTSSSEAFPENIAISSTTRRNP